LTWETLQRLDEFFLGFVPDGTISAQSGTKLRIDNQRVNLKLMPKSLFSFSRHQNGTKLFPRSVFSA
jgi:hypothetical protein